MGSSEGIPQLESLVPVALLGTYNLCHVVLLVTFLLLPPPSSPQP